MIEGRVIAVCISDTKDYPKHPQDSVIVGQHGFEGDAHSGLLRESHTNPGALKSNNRAVSIVADEVRESVNDELGLNMQPGDFNENILIRGLGDLHELEGGETLHFEGGVVLRVTEQNPPCTKLEDYNSKGIVKSTISREGGVIYNRRGLVATVENEGTLTPGESVFIKKDQ